MGIPLQKLLDEKLADKHNRKENTYILYDSNAIVSLMKDGYQLVQHLHKKAIWLEEADQDPDAPTFLVGWAIKTKMFNAGMIKKGTTTYPFQIYKLTKTAQKLRNTIKEPREITTPKKTIVEEKEPRHKKLLRQSRSLPARTPNTNNEKVEPEEKPDWWPRTSAVYRHSDKKDISGTGFVIHGVMFADGKVVIWWKSSSAVAQFDSFDKFRDVHLGGTKHGNSTIHWAVDEKPDLPTEGHEIPMASTEKLLNKIEPLTEPTKKEKEDPLKCFYCNVKTKLKRGRKPWRNVCAKKKCTTIFKEENAIHKKLQQLEKTT